MLQNAEQLKEFELNTVYPAFTATSIGLGARFFFGQSDLSEDRGASVLFGSTDLGVLLGGVINSQGSLLKQGASRLMGRWYPPTQDQYVWKPSPHTSIGMGTSTDKVLICNSNGYIICSHIPGINTINASETILMKNEGSCSSRTVSGRAKFAGHRSAKVRDAQFTEMYDRVIVSNSSTSERTIKGRAKFVGPSPKKPLG